jgi:nucleotide sugar dehydrogenase
MLPQNFSDSNVCVIGLGYVGLTLSVAMADAGFRVHGVERDPHIRRCLEARQAHFSEVGLNERLATQIERQNLTFSERVPATGGATIYVVTVGTPIGPDKRTEFGAIRAVIADIAKVLKDGDLVVLRSTVRIGTTTEVVQPMLDATGKKYELAFCPERTLEGKALLELRTLPQVVGGVDDQSTFRASQVFSFLTPSIVRVRNAETAEMVKLINNTQRDYLFAFANEVAAICDAVGVSAHEVIASGNLGYPRANLPYPGPVGGPCLEKDPYILAEGLERYNFTPALALAGRRWNESLPERSVQALADDLRSRGVENPQKIAVIGSAFKGRPETDDLRGSLVIPIIAALKQQFPDAVLVGWDPVVSPEAQTRLGLTAVDAVEDAFSGASLVVMQNNHQALERLKLPWLSQLMTQPGTIYDYWNQHIGLDPSELASGVVYRALGAFNLKSGVRA